MSPDVSVDRAAATDRLATVPVSAGVPTPRLPMPAVGAVGAPARTYRDPLDDVPPTDRPTVQRLAACVDRYLDATVDPAEILHLALALAWPAFPPGLPIDPAKPWVASRTWRRALARALAPHLTTLQALVRPWQDEAQRPCTRHPACTPREQCEWHKAWNYAWADHLIPRVYRILTDVPTEALTALTTGARP